MKYIKNLASLLIFCLCSFTILHAQERESRSVDSFQGVSVSASIDAELVKGSSNEVEIFVENYDLDDVETKVSGGILKLGMKKTKWTSGNWKKRKVRIVVTYTDNLEFLSASSSSDMVVKNVVKSDELEIKVSSSADMIVEVDVDDLDVSVSSSADLNISGRASNAIMKASSSADIEGEDLNIEDAELAASSSADITVGVSNSIEAKASSSADITYIGNPSQRDVSKSSGGSISREN